MIHVTIFCFYLNTILPQKIMHILKKTHENKNLFVHFFKKHDEHIQSYIQNPEKNRRWCLLRQYSTVLCAVNCIYKRAISTYDENNNIKTCSINFTICDFDVQTTSSDIFQNTLFAKFFHDISRVFRT